MKNIKKYFVSINNTMISRLLKNTLILFFIMLIMSMSLYFAQQAFSVGEIHSDDFNRANEPLENSVNWSLVYSVGDDVAAINNNEVQWTIYQAPVFHRFEGGSLDTSGMVWSEVPSGINRSGIIRMPDSGSGGYAAYTTGINPPLWQIVRIEANGSVTVLESGSGVLGATVNRVQADGNTITAYDTDGNFVASVTDSAWGSENTKAGIGGFSGNTATASSWEAGPAVVAPPATTDGYEFSGWLWGENYGWISLNSGNTGSSVDYKVVLGADNKISGWGWSSNVGWVCFGETCNGIAGLGSPPENTSFDTGLDTDTGKITGWANIISLGADGWISLRLPSGEIIDDVTQTGQMCYDCRPACSQWTENCADGEEGCGNFVCTENYDDKYVCNTCFTNTNYDGSNIPSSSSAVIGGSGKICTECPVENAGIVDESNLCYVEADGRTYCPQCNQCEGYGVNLNLSDSGLLGWGWNGTGDGVTGAGWVHFRPGFGSLVLPWLETKYGSIYSLGDVKQKVGGTKNNATYCIFASDIERVSSAVCDKNFINQVNLLFPSLVSGTGVYKNALGRVDVIGLSTPIYGIINKYRNQIYSISSLDDIVGGNLNNNVYVKEGDLSVDGEFIFNNSTTYGNGTIVVDGNLIINKNINYDNSAPLGLRQLASVAWIVKGDVIVSPEVENIAGVFIVLGEDDVALSGSFGDQWNPEYDRNGGGVFFSGDGSNSLTVNGLIVAKGFDFDRSYANIAQGSERIIYDGRFIANPPPGLKSLAESMPIIRDFSY